MGKQSLAESLSIINVCTNFSSDGRHVWIALFQGLDEASKGLKVGIKYIALDCHPIPDGTVNAVRESSEPTGEVIFAIDTGGIDSVDVGSKWGIIFS